MAIKGTRGGFMDRMAFNWKTRLSLYRHLSTQISNDVNTLDSLNRFLQRIERQKRKSVAKIIRSMIRAMKNGQGLSDAMSPWIPIDESMIISSGEISGNVSRAFDLVIEAKERAQRVQRTLKSALTTPVIYILAMMGMLWGIGEYVIPSLALALPPERAHGLIGGLYSASAFATSWLVLLPLGMIAILIALIVWSLPRWRGSYRIIAEKYFPWSFYRDIQGYTWLLGFSALLRAGMPDVDILTRQIEMANPWMKERLVVLRRQMTNGVSLNKALGGLKIGGRYAAFPSQDMIDSVDSMAGFRDFPDRIAKVAQQWADEMERTTATKAKAFGVAVELVMYLVMGLLMVSINSLSVQMGSVPGL